MGLLKGILFFLFLVAGIGFAIKNDQPVALKYYFDWVTLPLPLFLWVFLAFLIGLILSGAMALVSKFGLRARIRQRSRAIGELEQKRGRLIEGVPSSSPKS